MIDRDAVAAFYGELQGELCEAFEGLDDTSRFTIEEWERAGGGGGVTRVLTGDGPLEKAAVNVSRVWGPVPPLMSERLVAEAERFFATGISVIVHPRNPHAPSFHANLRYFETDVGTAWFGGGADLTPWYLYDEDARWFHGVLAAVCDRHPVADYDAWKAACDGYFYLPHRGEARGVGGIFFDHEPATAAFRAFQEDLGRHLAEAYVPVLARRVAVPYGEREERWQLRRRGRYAEFNLAIDRGTRFGLETGARPESVLASLPPRAHWAHGDDDPEPGSPEAALVEVLREPRGWR